MSLPSNSKLPITRKIWTCEPGASLPAEVEPVPEHEEKKYVLKLIRNINANLGTSLSSDICTERLRVTRPGSDTAKKTFWIFVGDSTAAGLYEAAKRASKAGSLVETRSNDPHSIKNTSEKIGEITANLKAAGTDYAAVLSLYDRQAYMSADGQRPTISEDGIGHIRGPVCITSKKQLKPTFRRTLPIFESMGEATKTVICPLPRFIDGPCCADATHATNVGTVSYIDSTRTNLPHLSCNISEQLRSEGIRKVRVHNSTPTLMDVPKEVAWAAGKPTKKAYSAMLEAISAETEHLLPKRALPPPKRPDPKRHHSGPTASASDKRNKPEQNRHASEPHYSADRYLQHSESFTPRNSETYRNRHDKNNRYQRRRDSSASSNHSSSGRNGTGTGTNQSRFLSEIIKILVRVDTLNS